MAGAAGASATGLTAATMVDVCDAISSTVTADSGAAVTVILLPSPKIFTVSLVRRVASSVASATVFTTTSTLPVELLTITGMSLIWVKVSLMPDATSTRVTSLTVASVASSVPLVTFNVPKPSIVLPACSVTTSLASIKENSRTPVPSASSEIL